MLYVILAAALAVIAVLALATLVIAKRPRKAKLPPLEGPSEEMPRFPEEGASVKVLRPGGVEAPPEALPVLELETPEPAAGRMVRLRSRLSRSQSLLGRGL